MGFALDVEPPGTENENHSISSNNNTMDVIIVEEDDADAVANSIVEDPEVTLTPDNPSKTAISVSISTDCFDEFDACCCSTPLTESCCRLLSLNWNVTFALQLNEMIETVDLVTDDAEREEGEIIDSEGAIEDLDTAEYEAISSDEEFHLRQKIEALEARNLELEKIASVIERPHNAYGKLRLFQFCLNRNVGTNESDNE